ncbi:MAG: hypothetical protein LBU87_07115 [Lactobacillales bacterium]|jgi:hypothetical protein|nr:hypothetical protein [Lactobacillales bacterium]
MDKIIKSEGEMKKLIPFFLLFLFSCVLGGIPESYAAPEQVSIQYTTSEEAPNVVNFFKELMKVPATSYLNIMNTYTSGKSGACWTCPLFSALFDGLNNLSTAIATNLSGIFLVLLGIGVLFMIVFKVGKWFVSTAGIDLAEFLNDLLKPLGRAMLAAIFLTYTVSFFSVLINPFLRASFELSAAIVESVGIQEMSVVTAARTETGVDLRTTSKPTRAELQAADEKTSGKVLEGSTREMLLYTMKKFSSSLMVGIAVGGYIFVMGCLDTFLPPVNIPNLKWILIGVTLLICYLYIFIAYPIKMLDALIRLAFVAALMPLWIILWVFPITAKFTKNAWDMFVVSCFTFIALGIVMALIMRLLESSPTIGDAMFLQQLMNNEISNVVNRYFSNFFPDVIYTVILAFLCYKMIDIAPKLASAFSGVRATNVNETATKHIKTAKEKVKGGAKKAIGVGQSGIATSSDAMRK